VRPGYGRTSNTTLNGVFVMLPKRQKPAEARLVDRTTEGAKFRLKVMNKLTTRGVGDTLIAVVAGLSRFPEGGRRRVPGVR
jgi:hypothetical protein